ncbi:calcitonin gene-related peptide type 1 receptor-like [Stegodyphus dumicola]|uniref:calcitonin gene-related peptide type 1 receptor-like n=1 Tax=Stegodyphus dumicola TaxID=202533 RepID=UPI0015A81BFF|nr:calcitonin gene-related peptide type 1 receptor-like [Stegodyphus dumicola]
MFPTVILILIQALMFCCEENVTSEESISKQRMTCRTESRVPLSYDQYKLKTCAKCYTYMPRSSFKVQFQYRNGILRDPLINMTYEANPVNTSQEILDSFIEEPYIWNWKGCCIAAVECCHEMMKAPPVLTGLFCPRTWDGWQCWQDTPAGTTAKQPCAAHIYFQTNPPSCTKYAYKVCWSNGTWYQNEQLREWTNYSKCGRVEEHRRYLYFHISTYSVSIISMIPALVIFSVYK